MPKTVSLVSKHFTEMPIRIFQGKSFPPQILWNLYKFLIILCNPNFPWEDTDFPKTSLIVKQQGGSSAQYQRDKAPSWDGPFQKRNTGCKWGKAPDCRGHGGKAWEAESRNFYSFGRSMSEHRLKASSTTVKFSLLAFIQSWTDEAAECGSSQLVTSCFSSPAGERVNISLKGCSCWLSCCWHGYGDPQLWRWWFRAIQPEVIFWKWQKGASVAGILTNRSMIPYCSFCCEI